MAALGSRGLRRKTTAPESKRSLRKKLWTGKGGAAQPSTYRRQRSYPLLENHTSRMHSHLRLRANPSTKTSVRALGLIMDAGLEYNEHMVTAANKGLEAAMELRRLRGLTPATARQLFTSTIAPAVDYASNVWMHAAKSSKCFHLTVATGESTGIDQTTPRRAPLYSFSQAGYGDRSSAGPWFSPCV